MTPPSVTIVVPVRNEDPQRLHACLLSIDRQDHPGLDVVVVDDGSDNVHDVVPVHDAFSHGRFLVVLREDHADLFDRLETDLVVIVRSDAVLEPGAIADLVDSFGDARVTVARRRRTFLAYRNAPGVKRPRGVRRALRRRPASLDRTARAALELRSPAGILRTESRWAREIAQTVEDGRSFRLHWQPVRHLWSGGVFHAEALLRLEHDGHLLLPDRFLAIAERHGAMASVDQWVVHQAVALLAREAAAGRRLRLEVNVSAASVASDLFVALLARHLDAYAVAPRTLVVAIPETVAVDDPDAARAFARKVRALGCLVAIDRVGASDPAGGTTARVLARVPADYVKLDGGLVRNLPNSDAAAAGVRALVGVARRAGVETVALHVGDEGTVRALERIGVDYAQGFHLGQPVPTDTPLADARGPHQRRPAVVGL